MKIIRWLLLLSLACAPLFGSRVTLAALPNLLWITAEDLSPNLGCYGDPYARTPRLDRFAGDAVRYTRAFATAPVCSPARSCLITGLYATSLGTQRLRSAFPIPDRFQGFPAHLRAAGYYTSNNVKTDYNTANEPEIIAASWDACSAEATWRGRAEGQPFFSVFNLMTTHQSRTSVWSFEEFEKQVGSRLPPDQRHDPAKAPLPPYYPDTELARRTLARYYDCIRVMDAEAGAILDELEADGLREDTIVFFYSDHGMGLPRGKRVLHDSGLHVPLLIRFPAKWQHLAPAAAGQAVDRLVSFVDFAPTMLSLAGLTIPDAMQGGAFLGRHAGPPRQYVYGARDRVDEADDLARSVRDERWLYIRNYQPHLSWMQRERYSDQSAFRREFLHLADLGLLEAGPQTYASPRRAREELYDTAEDPHQMHNLAGSAAHREVLERLRTAHQHWVQETRDLGFLPEPEAWRITRDTTPYAWARAQANWPGEVLEVADTVGATRWQSELPAWLDSPDPAIRYWGITAALADPDAAPVPDGILRQALDDPAVSVRIQAALIAVRQGPTPAALDRLEQALVSDDVDAILAAARALETLGDAARPLRPAMAATRNRAAAREAGHPCWMFVRFALEEALER